MSWYAISKLVEARKYDELAHAQYLKELPNADKLLRIACREMAIDELFGCNNWGKIMERATELYEQTKARVGC